ncbi:MAG: hypothetical protein ABIZ69_00190, partial [Ilumatobacteraceae bacterium]
APAPTTTEVPPIVPYYAANPPREYTVRFAEFTDPDRHMYGPGTYQLWATDGATATTGSWFTIDSYLDGAQASQADDAYRVQAGDRSIAVAHAASGLSSAQFTTDGLVHVGLTTFGFSDADLIRLATSLNADSADVSPGDMSLIPGFKLISRVQPWLAVQGDPAEQIIYSSNLDVFGGLAITVATPPATDAGGSPVDRQIALRFLLDHTTPFSVAGHSAVAGAVTAQRDSAVATWVAGDHIVTLTGQTTVPQIIAIARTVHQVTSDEWDGMQMQATRANSDSPAGNFDVGTPVPVSFGTDGDAVPWTIKVAIQKFSDEQLIGWTWDNSEGFGSRLEATAHIDTVVQGTRTYVLAELPRAFATTAQLQISRDGFDPVVVPFNDTDPTVACTFAAYAFSEPTTYTAQIVGADGAVLAAWPTT